MILEKYNLDDIKKYYVLISSNRFGTLPFFIKFLNKKIEVGDYVVPNFYIDLIKSSTNKRYRDELYTFRLLDNLVQCATNNNLYALGFSGYDNIEKNCVPIKFIETDEIKYDCYGKNISKHFNDLSRLVI